MDKHRKLIWRFFFSLFAVSFILVSSKGIVVNATISNSYSFINSYLNGYSVDAIRAVGELQDVRNPDNKKDMVMGENGTIIMFADLSGNCNYSTSTLKNLLQAMNSTLKTTGIELYVIQIKDADDQTIADNLNYNKIPANVFVHNEGYQIMSVSSHLNNLYKSCMAAAVEMGKATSNWSYTLPMIVFADKWDSIAEISTATPDENQITTYMKNAGYEVDLGFEFGVQLLGGEVSYRLAYELLDKLNDLRDKSGLNALTMDAELLDGAMLRAAESSILYTSSHVRPDGSGACTVSKLCVGENALMGCNTAEIALSTWKNSPPHYTNMMNPEYHSVGIGVYIKDNEYYWIMDLGRDLSKEASRNVLENNVDYKDYEITAVSTYVKPYVRSTDVLMSPGDKLPINIYVSPCNGHETEVFFYVDIKTSNDSVCKISDNQKEMIAVGKGKAKVSFLAGGEFIAIEVTVDNSIKAKLDEIMKTTGFKPGGSPPSSYPKYKTCFGFCNVLVRELFGHDLPSQSSHVYSLDPSSDLYQIGSTLTIASGTLNEDTIKALFLQSRPGDIIQMDYTKSDGTDSRHTMMVYSVSDSGVVCYHAGSSEVYFGGMWTSDGSRMNWSSFTYFLKKSDDGISVYRSKHTSEVTPPGNAPTISDVIITNRTNSSYTVSCTVSDNGNGVSSVKFPSWTYSSQENDQNNTIWHKGSKDGNTWSCTINKVDYNNEEGDYITQIYAYDDYGNSSWVDAGITSIESSKPVISDVVVSDISIEGYTVSCKVIDSGGSGLDRVEFPTSTESIPLSEISKPWPQGSVDGDRYTYRVNSSDYDDETGNYYTCIYAYDCCGNLSKYSLDVDVCNPAEPEYNENGWNEDEKGYFYIKNGSRITSDWLLINKEYYYFDIEGYMVTGKAFIGKYWYYFNADGIMRTGWIDYENTWYYATKSGSFQTGWKKLSNKWYYFNKSSGAMIIGAKKISGKIYVFSSSGAMMKSGWKKDPLTGDWYYLDKNGVALTKKWKKTAGKWYYLGADGKMLANTSQKIGKKVYMFKSNGVCKNP